METNTTSPFLAALLSSYAAPPSNLDWFGSLKSHALERANALSVPTVRDEDWRFTDLTPLYKHNFGHVTELHTVSQESARSMFVPEAQSRLTFIDGRFVAELSQVVSSAGVLVAPLSRVLTDQEQLLRQHLGRVAQVGDHPFRAMNTAWLAEGAVVHIAKNAASAYPIHLLFVSTQAQVVTHPRVLLVSEPGSDAMVIEEHVGMADLTYWSNPVTEVVVGANARLKHVKLQRDSKSAFHIASCAVEVEKDAQYLSNAIALGARISRNEIEVRQLAENMTTHLDGLALISGRQLADTHSFVDHAQAHGVSRQLHKCVVAGGAHAVFNGRVLVREGAQKTDSAQESRNLLLSEKARVDTKPQLEIFADDVKCSHGATVGQVEAEEVFYLRSRGLSEMAAINLLTYGFAAEIVDRIDVKSIVANLRRAVMAQTGSEGLQ